MSTLDDLKALVQAAGVACHIGYAPTGAVVPYAVIRPLFIGGDVVALTGEVIDWDHQESIYCCGASVAACFNMAVLLMGSLQGAPFSGTTLSTSMGYNGAQVEGHYESQITVQLNQGVLA